MKRIADQGECVHLFLGHRDARGILSDVEFGPDLEPSCRPDVPDAVDDCSASITFAGRVASFKDVTRHPQNDRTRCLGRIASTRHPQPGTGRPKVRQHAAARGVLRPRVRQSAASRDRRGRPGPPPFMPRGKTHSCYRSRGAGGASPVDAAFSPVCHFTMHHQLHPFTCPPPAGAARGRTGVRGVPRSVT